MKTLPILALNETRKTLLASRLRMARSVGARRGANGGRILPGDGLWIESCRQVNTSGMDSSLDLLFLDADHRVVEKVTSMPPGAVSPEVSRAMGVLELPEGTIPATQTEIGDRILIEAIVAG
jgi:uncharacterized protein